MTERVTYYPGTQARIVKGIVYADLNDPRSPSIDTLAGPFEVQLMLQRWAQAVREGWTTHYYRDPSEPDGVRDASCIRCGKPLLIRTTGPDHDTTPDHRRYQEQDLQRIRAGWTPVFDVTVPCEGD